MTLSTLTSRVSYPGAGSTGPFAIPFRFLATTDLLVTKRSALGAETTLALTTHYTVTGANEATGNLTLVTALAVGETLVIRRKPALTQPTSIRNQGAYFPATIEEEFDRLAMQLQGLKDDVDRAIKLKESIAGSTALTELEPLTGKVVAGTGTGWTMSALDSGAVALPGQSRTVTTLSAYLANNAVFNVKDYGATGDGVTNDGAAIRLADTKAAVAKGLVYFPEPPVSYLWTGDLTPSPGAHWLGGGKRQYARKLKAGDATARLLLTDSCKLTGFAVYGSAEVSPYVGIGIQVGGADFAGYVELEDVFVLYFQTGLRLGAALWFTASNCQFEYNRIGVDLNAISAAHYSNAITFADCVSARNERNGIGSTYTPIGNNGFFWTGGSIENNCTADPATYPQIALGNQRVFEIQTYVEYGISGTKPRAIDVRNSGRGKIQAYFNGSSDGVYGDATSQYITIANSLFTSTTNKCINMPGAYQCKEEANSFDLAASTNVLPTYIHNDAIAAVNGATFYYKTKRGEQSTTVGGAGATDVFRFLSEVAAVQNISLCGRFEIHAVDVANAANQSQYVYDVTSAANLIGNAVLTQVRRNQRGTDVGTTVTPFALADDGVGGAVKLQFTKNAAITNVRVEVMFDGLAIL